MEKKKDKKEEFVSVSASIIVYQQKEAHNNNQQMKTYLPVHSLSLSQSPLHMVHGASDVQPDQPE